MVEILFLFGVSAWLLALVFEYLYTLPVFWSVVTALIAIPCVTAIDYQRSLRRQFLTGVEEDRAPVPPEVFRWKIIRPRWKKQIVFCLSLQPILWPLLFLSPARASLSWDSLLGWLTGFAAIVATSVLLSRLTLYFQVAQWFDQMTPRIAGWFWKMMYRYSDNMDYLPENKSAEAEESEKNVETKLTDPRG